MTEKSDNLALHLLREIRVELTELKLSMKQLANTQASLLQLTSTQENRLLRIENDISTIKKRIDLIEAQPRRS